MLNIRKSIFPKLLGAYFIAFLIIMIGGTAVRFLSVSSPNIAISVAHANRYVNFFVEEIGNPPNITIANNIAQETGLNIQIIGPELNWTNAPKEKKFHENLEDKLKFLPNLDDFTIEIENSNYHYYFTKFHSEHLISITLWLIIISTIITALTISYLIVRHLLKPLKTMNNVALELGVSDWKKRVNPKGEDEFSVLGKAIDKMADRIELYILSMQDLLIAISHELRSPLTRMKVALEFIDNKNIKLSLSEEIETLDKLTGNLLEQRKLASGSGTLNKRPVEVHKWITPLINHYKNKSLDISVELIGSDKSIELDKNLMDMAVRNLIENCIKHAPGSPIKVVLNTNKGFKIEVNDKGPGMVESLIKRTGEPFLLGDTSRGGKRQGGGFGLGLSIVKAIIESHGGTFYTKNLLPSGFSVVINIE